MGKISALNSLFVIADATINLGIQGGTHEC